jgi:hypothetical protein
LLPTQIAEREIGLLALPVIGFQPGQSFAISRSVEGHINMFISREACKSPLQLRIRGSSQHVSHGRRHDLERLMAGIAFSHEITEPADQIVFAWTLRQLLNLSRDLRYRLRPFGIG